MPNRLTDRIAIVTGAAQGMGHAIAKALFEEGTKVAIVDIDEDALEELQKRYERENIQNIKIVLGKFEDPLFPIKNLDIVIMVYVFHDLEKPVKFIQNVMPYLKPGAPIVIVDRDPDKYGGEYDHFYTPESFLHL